MAEVQMIQLRSQTPIAGGTKRAGGQSDFSGMLQEICQSASEQKRVDESAQDKTVDTEEYGPNQEAVTDGKDDLRTGPDSSEGSDDTGEIGEEETVPGLTGAEILQLAGMLHGVSQSDQQPNGQLTDSGGNAEGVVIQEVGAESDAANALRETAADDGMQPVAEMQQAAEGDAVSEPTDQVPETLTNTGQIQLPKQSAEETGQAVLEQKPVREQADTVKPEQAAAEPEAPKQPEETVSGDSALNSQQKPSGQDISQEGSPDALQGYTVTENRFAGMSQTAAADTAKAVVKTSPETLPEDVGKSIVSNLSLRNGNAALELTLEPASLGKITITMVYEDGKAALSLISDNPKTLEILSQRAGEIAQILEDKTGQETVVYVPERQQYTEEQSKQQDRDGYQQEREERPKKEQTDSFAQQLRLGLV